MYNEKHISNLINKYSMTKKMRWPVKWLMLFGLLLAAGHMKAASDWVVGESYYLYNTGIGQFIRGGNNYGTRASFGSTGDMLTVNAVEGSDELYRLVWSRGNGLFIGATSEMWMDMGNQGHCSWQIQKGTGDTWRISIEAADETYGEASKGKTYMGFCGDYSAPNSGSTPYVLPILPDVLPYALGIDWIFMTKEEYDAVQQNVADAYEVRKALYKYVSAAKNIPSFSASELDIFSRPETTKAELEALLETLPGKVLAYAKEHASKSNPIDVSFLIEGAGCGDAGYAGWTKTGDWGNNSTYFANGNSVLGGRFYERWKNNAGLDDGDIYQTVSGLFNGIYTLGADINATRQDHTDWEITGVNLYAVGAEKQTVACPGSGNGVPDYYSVDFLVTNGTARIGVECVSTNANWLAMDNFRLYYKGIDLTALRQSLDKLVETARELTGQGMPSVVKQRLNGAIAAAETVEETETAIMEATNNLSVAIAEAKSTSVAYNELAGNIEAAQALYVNSKPATPEAAEAMTVALETAKGSLAEASTLEALQQAVVDLEAARRAYMLQSVPANGTTYDLTFKVANAKMNEGNTAWQSTYTNGMNFRVWSDASVNSAEYAGNFYERWSSPALTDAPAIWQTVSGLQNGVYEVRAAAFCRDGSGFSLRANEDKVALTDGKMKYYTVRTPVTDGQLTIALYAEPGNTKDWSGLADVSLTYYGEDLEPLKAEVALRKQQLAEWAQSTQAPLVALKNYLTGEVQQMQPENETAQGYYELISTLKTIQTDAESTLAAYARVANWRSKYDDIVRQSAETEALEAFRSALEAAEAEAGNAMSAEAMVTAAAGMTQAFCVYLPQGKATEGRFDLTVFLDNASFDATGDGWNETLGWGAGVVEKFQASFNAWQLLTGMPAGMYTLCVQAAYRTSANETAYEAYQNGTAEVLASLYAGTAQKKVKNIFDDSSDVSYYQTKDWMNDYQTPVGKYVPNSLNGANEYFKNGLYWNSLSFEQEEAGDLTIGLKAENVPGGNGAWTLFDNFRLYYGVEDVELDENEAYAVAEEKWADVTSNRVIKAGRWATLWVPFDIPAAQLDAFEEVKQLSEVVLEDETVRVRFADVKEQGIRAGQPYLVRTVRDWTMAAEKVLLQPVAFTPVTVEGAVMKCVEQPGDIQGMYYIANNSFYLADVPVDSKSYRAVIELPLSQEVKSVLFDFGETTAVEGVDAAQDGATVDVYTLSGIKVKSGVPAARALDGLNKGVYIVNGTKVVK